jgi:hypothetical protein
MALIRAFLGAASDPSAGGGGGGANALDLVYSETLIFFGIIPGDDRSLRQATGDSVTNGDTLPDQGMPFPTGATKVRAWINYVSLSAAAGPVTLTLRKNGVSTGFNVILTGPVPATGLRAPAIVGTALVTYAVGDTWDWLMAVANPGAVGSIHLVISTCFYA